MTQDGRRFFRHGELPLVLLVMIRDQPRHAYQLLARLERLFAPSYEPSTGSIYPAVAALVDSGLVAAQDEGRRRVYSITAKGRRTLERSGEALAEIEARTGVRLTTEDLDAVLARFAARLKQAPSVDVAAVEKELERVVERVLQ
jgi:DNA-binding PadR family transcriptional regulator